MLAIELEPQSMEPATAPEAQHETKQYCCKLKVSVHICHVSAPTLPRFSWDYKALKLVVTLMVLFTIYPLKNIKSTIYTYYCYDYDVLYECFGINTSVVYRWQIGQLAQQWTQQKRRPEKTHHDQASTYKEFCEGRATELYNYCEGKQQRKNIFHIFIYIFIFI